MWIELKRVHGTCTGKQVLEIPWRPGQQAWLNDVQSRGMMCMTLACFDDGIIKIQAGIYHENRVPQGFGFTKYYKDIRSLLE